MYKGKHRRAGPGSRSGPGAERSRSAPQRSGPGKGAAAAHSGTKQERGTRRSRPVAATAPAPAPAATPTPARSERSGTLWYYGVHPILAALANPKRRCLRLLLAREADRTVGQRLRTLAGRRPDCPAPQQVEREVIDRLLPRGAVHQGVAAELEALPELDLDELCRRLEGVAQGRVVVLDQVTDPHNVGAVLRSAAAFGAAAVVLPERHAPGATGALAKAAAGAVEKVPLIRVVNLARALESLKRAGFWCVGFDADATTALPEADLTGKVAIILGAEGEGLRRLTRENCDLLVRIPIAKGMESLNVSNAAAIALYELARRG